MATIGVNGPDLVLLPRITAPQPDARILATVADELRRQGFRRVRVAADAVEFGKPGFLAFAGSGAVGGGTCRLGAAGGDRWVRLDLRYDDPGFLLVAMAAAVAVVALPLAPASRALLLGVLLAVLVAVCRTSARQLARRIGTAVRRPP